MALRAVPEHPKFAELMIRLGLAKYEALGILESLWHFTGKFCPRGNVGKFTDSQIEAWIGWKGESGSLISALVEAHWLDLSSEFRIVVHDWHEHADATTKKQIGRTGQGFIQDTPQTLSGHVQDIVSQDGNHDGPPEPEPEPEPVNTISSNPPGCDDRVHVREVFSYYLERTGRNPAQYQLTEPRIKIGLRRFRECKKIVAAPEDENAKLLMRDAIDEMLKSAWHRGENPQRKKYLEWDQHVFRSFEQMEKWYRGAQ